MDPFDSSSVVRLVAARRMVLDLDRARELLHTPEQAWLGVHAEDIPVEPALRTFRTDLRLPLHAAGREVTFRKAALVELGPPYNADGALRIDISWRSANLAPLFPVFAGQLTVRPDGLTLDGWYAPPGGRLGLALDRLLLGIAARCTARWFLGLVARGLGSNGREGRQPGAAPETEAARLPPGGRGP